MKKTSYILQQIQMVPKDVFITRNKCGHVRLSSQMNTNYGGISVQNRKTGRGKRHWADHFGLTWFFNGQQFPQMHYPAFAHKTSTIWLHLEKKFITCMYDNILTLLVWTWFLSFRFLLSTTNLHRVPIPKYSCPLGRKYLNVVLQELVPTGHVPVRYLPFVISSKIITALKWGLFSTI